MQSEDKTENEGALRTGDDARPAGEAAAPIDDIPIGERFYRNFKLGNAQAWSAPVGDPSVVVGLYAGVQHAGDTRAYCSMAINMSAAEARDLAAVLSAAADYAEANATGASLEPEQS